MRAALCWHLIFIRAQTTLSTLATTILQHGCIRKCTSVCAFVFRGRHRRLRHGSRLGFWNETWRGQIPIGWAPDPNLSARFPIMLDYMLNTLTPNDRLTTGDSGGGYLNPTQLFEPRQYSGLPSANDVWVSHNVPLYQKFDMTFTGERLWSSARLPAAC